MLESPITEEKYSHRSASPSSGDTQPFPTCLMKNLSVSRLPNSVLRKVSRQVTNPARLRRDEGDLIRVCEPLIARKTPFWTSQAAHFIPLLDRLRLCIRSVD